MNHVKGAVLRIQQVCPCSKVILAGDLNTMSDTEIVIRTGMTSVVSQPTRGNNILDRIYVSEFEYDAVKVVKSAVKSDHQAIVAYTGATVMTVNKTRRVPSESIQRPSTPPFSPGFQIRFISPAQMEISRKRLIACM